MELSWLTKLRITLVMGLGVIVIGILGWSMAAPDDPMGLVRMSNMSVISQILLLLMALALGFVSYHIAWPYGFEIGILAVPAGLAVWGCRSGKITGVLQTFPTAMERQAVFIGLRWDAFYWLVVVLVGVVGASLAKRLRPSPPLPLKEVHAHPKLDAYFGSILALLISLLVGQFLMNGFAQDIPLAGTELASQPVMGQTAFAIMMAFGAGAYLVRHFLHLDYTWSVVSTALLCFVGSYVHTKLTLLTDLAAKYPAVCFSNAVLSTLPIQMVAFGTIGAVIGYWLAIRYRYWRTHEFS